MPLFERFCDNATESAYVRSARQNRRAASRTQLFVGIVIMISYIVIIPWLNVPIENALIYNAAAIFFILCLLAWLIFLQTEFYLSNPWADLISGAVLAIAMFVLNDAIAESSDLLGLSPVTIGIINFILLAYYGSNVFVAAAKPYAIWAAGIFVAFCVYLVAIGASERILLYGIGNFSSVLLLAVYANWAADRRSRKLFESNRLLDIERTKTEELLFNVLPKHVVSRLRQGEAVADRHNSLTAVFVDVVGFSKLSLSSDPQQLVERLNDFFSEADEIVEDLGLEKVKTIGDAYLLVAGGIASTKSNAVTALHFCRELLHRVSAMKEDAGSGFDLRIGVHTGPAIGGVIGSKRFAYDYWGDTLNLASRLQAIAPVNGVAVSEATYTETQDQFEFDAGELIEIKGMGRVVVYSAKLLQQP